MQFVRTDSLTHKTEKLFTVAFNNQQGVFFERTTAELTHAVVNSLKTNWEYQCVTNVSASCKCMLLNPKRIYLQLCEYFRSPSLKSRTCPLTIFHLRVIITVACPVVIPNNKCCVGTNKSVYIRCFTISSSPVFGNPQPSASDSLVKDFHVFKNCRENSELNKFHDFGAQKNQIDHF